MADENMTGVCEEINGVAKDEPKENVTEIGESVPKVDIKKENTPLKKAPIYSGGTNLNIYRVKVSGLPRFYSSMDPLLSEFKKMLRVELKLDFQYIRSPKKLNSWLYITFTNQADQERALTLLKRYTWKNRTIICTLVVADVLKRKGEDGNNDLIESKKAKLDIPLEEQMLMSTIPYHTIGYDEQLSKKSEEASCHLKRLFELIQERTYTLSRWIDEQIKKHGKNLPFALEELKASPLIDGYRNRCEFRVGINPQNQEVTVGYRVDNQEDGSVWVAPPDSLRHLPKQMIQVVKVFEKFIKESPYPPRTSASNPEDKGIWRLLSIRMNKKGEVMIVVMIYPSESELPIVENVKQLIVNHFTHSDRKELNIVSIYLHLDKDKTGGIVGEKKQATGVEHLWGTTHLEESILDLNLEVTPSFYFHWNTYGAEQLYNAVKELADVDSETTVLDLCCGSGGMGLTLAKHCKDVLGVELMDVNVEDAKSIAAKNGLTNCEFLQGKIDDIFPQVLEKVKGKKVVPILDPPRNGISQRMIINLRNMKEADKVIYVCSNHKLPLKNLLDLGTAERGPFSVSNPFVPTRVIPIDMSPHALRYELVILCERVDMKNIPKPTRTAPTTVSKKDRQRKRGGRIVRERYAMQAQRQFHENFGNGYGAGPSRFDSMHVSARDSLYPPPLRRALYQESQRNYQDFPTRDFAVPRFGNYNDYDDFPPAPRGGLYDAPRRLMDDFSSRFGNGFDRNIRDPSVGGIPPPNRVLGGSVFRARGAGGRGGLYDAPRRLMDDFSSRFGNGFDRNIRDPSVGGIPPPNRVLGGSVFRARGAGGIPPPNRVLGGSVFRARGAGGRGGLYDAPRRLMDDFSSRFGNGFDRNIRGPSVGGIPPPNRVLGRSVFRARGAGGIPPREGNSRAIPSLFDAPLRPPSNYDSDVSRYSNFRRDVEDAIDSSYPQYQSNKFSFESAILEREKRAFEARLSRGLTNGATQYDNRKQTFRPFGKRGRGSSGGGVRGGDGVGGTWR